MGVSSINYICLITIGIIMHSSSKTSFNSGFSQNTSQISLNKPELAAVCLSLAVAHLHCKKYFIYTSRLLSDPKNFTKKNSNFHVYAAALIFKNARFGNSKYLNSHSLICDDNHSIIKIS